MTSPLQGIKVLDLTRFIAGPHCGMILGDMGADVIKVEKKGSGDDSRHFPPFQGGESLYGMALNRNKRSITLNFREARAQDLLRLMVKEADILLENFRPGTMEQMGCGWKELSAINPRLIMTRLSGFGQDGPYAQRPGFDGIAQAMSGLMGLTGAPDGPPYLAGTFYIDYMTAMYGATATLGALNARHLTDRGQMIDVSLLDSAVSLLTTAIPTRINKGETLTRTGNRDRYSSPANVFETGSGDFVLLLSGTNPLFGRLAEAIGQPELSADTRFSTVDARLQNAEAIEQVLRGWIGARETDVVLEVIGRAGVPCAKVATIDEVVENPQLRHRDQIVEIDHPTAGKVSTAGVTMKLSDTPLSIRRPSPTLGQHTSEILLEWLALTDRQIEELMEDAVI
ncbi:MAG: CoA transferase [Alphaproteobacteria bacterium]|nr:CoA transferase [Alphaproteobacteria bacterium]MBU1551269.1 CoA transferase [Alphaproteobacteria bacterium]MBU2334796.1 CoA transferase [Alphaproteobacteria bacterium]MBU2389299.1 CoA transferase [Alphaproteobacteria bacterium]